MTVQELIDILSEQEPDAEVLLMTQQSWPFEYSIFGVTSRAELIGEDTEEEAEAPCSGRDGGPASTDVFLVEGTQLRYGSKDAWNVAHR